MALNSGIQTYQILTNDDEVCTPSSSSIFLFVISSPENLIIYIRGTKICKTLKPKILVVKLDGKYERHLLCKNCNAYLITTIYLTVLIFFNFFTIPKSMLQIQSQIESSQASIPMRTYLLAIEWRIKKLELRNEDKTFVKLHFHIFHAYSISQEFSDELSSAPHCIHCLGKDLLRMWSPHCSYKLFRCLGNKKKEFYAV